MSEYTLTIENMETDRFRQLSPRLLLEHCLSCLLSDLERDGCGGKAISEAAGAVWMLSHMRLTQSAPILPGDRLLIRTSPRMEKRCCYFFETIILRDDAPIAQLQTSFLPVNSRTRHIVRLSELAALWKAPPREVSPSPLHRLRPNDKFVPCSSDTVRFSDCDGNGHMTSGAYVSLVCDALGFWESDSPRFMRMMQVDYSSEVYPGTLLRFERGELDGLPCVRGIKPDGKTAFTAVCDF